MSHELGVDYAGVDGDKPPDLVAAKASGLRFAIVRASWSKWTDVTASRDRAAIRDAGLIFGAYMGPAIGDAYPSPEDQVDQLYNGACLIPGRDLAPVIDIEFPGRGIAATGLSRAQIGAWLARARAAVVAKFGCDPIVYSSARVLDGDDTDGLAGAANDALSGCAPWLARYPFKTRIDAIGDDPGEVALVDALPLPPPAAALGPVWISQYQGDALHMHGFSATVDMDRFIPLEIGEHSMRVTWLQQRIGADAADGYFGPATERALLAYQASGGLPDTGSVDLATFTRLSWIRP